MSAYALETLYKYPCAFQCAKNKDHICLPGKCGLFLNEVRLAAREGMLRIVKPLRSEVPAEVGGTLHFAAQTTLHYAIGITLPGAPDFTEYGKRIHKVFLNDALSEFSMIKTRQWRYTPK